VQFSLGGRRQGNLSASIPEFQPAFAGALYVAKTLAKFGLTVSLNHSSGQGRAGVMYLRWMMYQANCSGSDENCNTQPCSTHNHALMLKTSPGRVDHVHERLPVRFDGLEHCDAVCWQRPAHLKRQREGKLLACRRTIAAAANYRLVGRAMPLLSSWRPGFATMKR